MTGQEFLDSLRDEFEMGSAEDALACQVAASMDRQLATTSLRDQRAEGRLITEQLRALFARIEVDQRSEGMSRSELGRKLAHARWGPKAVS